MSSTLAADLCRVVLMTPTASAEIALPAGVPVGDLLPALVQQSGAAKVGTPDYEQGWVLQRLGHDPLDEDATPAALGIKEGETLYLRPASSVLPPFHFDDLIDGVASGIKNRPWAWRAEMTRWMFLTFCGAILAVGLGVVFQAGPVLVRAAVAGAMALAALVGAGVCSRAVDDRGAALVLGCAAVPYGALAGFVVPTAPADPTLSAPNLLCAGVAATFTALIALGLVGTAKPLFGAVATTGAWAAIGGLFAVFGAGQVGVAAIIAALVLILATLAPRLAFGMAKMRLPMLPTSADDLSDDIEPFNGKEVLAAAAAADRHITWIFAAAGAISAGALAILATGDGWAPPATAAVVAAALLLRSRVLLDCWQRVSVIAPAALAIGLLAIRLGGSLPAALVYGLLVSALAAAAAASVAFSRVMPGRRIHPLWGRIADVVEWIVVIAVIPLVLADMGLYTWARALGG